MLVQCLCNAKGLTCINIFKELSPSVIVLGNKYSPKCQGIIVQEPRLLFPLGEETGTKSKPHIAPFCQP